MRTYPSPSQDALLAFIFNSVRIERLPIDYGNLQSSMGMKETDPGIDPHACGHFKAINTVLKIAKDEKLLDSIDWVKKIHEQVMLPIVNYDWLTLNPDPFQRSACGTYRISDKRLGESLMPNPMRIPSLMEDLRKKLKVFDGGIAPKMSNSRLLTSTEIEDIRKIAYSANLDICCIKPFRDGSNRVGRLVENCLRLHWGLPWRVTSYDEKDHLLADQQERQAQFK